MHYSEPMFMYFCVTMSTQRLYLIYTVENVGGHISQDPTTEVTHLGLNQPVFSNDIYAAL